MKHTALATILCLTTLCSLANTPFEIGKLPINAALTVKECYAWESDGQITNGGIDTWKTYHTNQSGQLTLIEEFDSEGELFATTNFTYNSAGEPTSQVVAWSDGTISEQITFSYSAEGKLIHKCCTTGSGELLWEYEYTHGAEGYTRLQRLDTDTYRYEHTLTPEGLTKQMDCYNSIGLLSDRSTYQYDTEGRLLDETTLNPKGEQQARITQSYDQCGNLVERVEYRGQRAWRTTTYSHTYSQQDPTLLQQTIVRVEGAVKQIIEYFISYN